MDFLTKTSWFKIWLIIKYLFLLADVVLFLIFVFGVIKFWKYRPKLKIFVSKPKPMPTLRREIFKEHWKSILENLNLDTLESRKLAIIEAEAVVVDVLKDLGYEGEHLADRLAKLSVQDFPYVEKLWEAHRLRNEIVNTPGLEISQEQAKKIIETYENFLKEIGIL